ncbi:MAG: 50S ribosomal protein L30 [Flavobacteriales bacterium]|nr:50S ribosomal protein L30 [Flavobacteriales bacterium]MDP4717936.1 50S ribosomal protein L30 [Flavobacteriales bacterium]MDP4732035.1 50S ribosomal protein L30 [Flavobacteriales bacterium]MDP4817467.1 50S ribosomal protein L30 [Flavobacteriales bacterium]MDP4950298.1 50S ribosomal protein L30 [Flavobacteriales bacterium]
MMAKVVITQVKSAIDRPKRQKATIEALGIKKLNVSVEKELTPNIEGMIRAVSHLLKVEYK